MSNRNTDAGHFNINSVAVNPTRTWYNYVMIDPGLFHGILSTVALYMHSHIGIPIVKEDILFHRGQTMGIINKRLNDIKGIDASLLIGAIATILSFEVRKSLNLYASSWILICFFRVESLRKLLHFESPFTSAQTNDRLRWWDGTI